MSDVYFEVFIRVGFAVKRSNVKGSHWARRGVLAIKSVKG